MLGANSKLIWIRIIGTGTVNQKPANTEPVPAHVYCLYPIQFVCELGSGFHVINF